MELAEFEIMIIEDVLKRRFGLAGFIAAGKDDKASIDTLASQTGMRRERIEQNLHQIKQICKEHENRQ